jgi:putative serine protease PepD
VVTAGITGLLAGTVGRAVGFIAARDMMPAVGIAVSSVDAPSAAADGTIAGVGRRAAGRRPGAIVTASAGDGTARASSPSARNGYVVANHHVAGPAASDGKIEVVFADGKSATGKVVRQQSRLRPRGGQGGSRQHLPTLALGKSGERTMSAAIP